MARASEMLDGRDVSFGVAPMIRTIIDMVRRARIHGSAAARLVRHHTPFHHVCVSSPSLINPLPSPVHPNEQNTYIHEYRRAPGPWTPARTVPCSPAAVASSAAAEFPQTR